MCRSRPRSDSTAKIGAIARTRGCRLVQDPSSSDLGAPSLNHDDVSPDAVMLTDTFALAHDTEPAPCMQRETCSVLRKDAALDGPNTLLFACIYESI